MIVTLRRAQSHHHSDVFEFPISDGQVEETYLKIAKVSDGTLVTITSSALWDWGAEPPRELDNRRRYFRIRITLPGNGANVFINSAIPNDRLLTSGFDVTEYLDFRINQARNLPTSISGRLPSELSHRHIAITGLDFLLVVLVSVDVVGGHPTFHKCRLLETNLWKNYVDKDHLQRGMVIYHWKEHSDGKHVVDFNVFIKLRVRLSERSIIWRYLWFTLVIGCAIGVVGNGFYDLIKCLPGIWGWVWGKMLLFVR